MARGTSTARPRATLAAGILFLACCTGADAAQCLVNGRWYPYTSPECSGGAPPAPAVDPLDAPAPAGGARPTPVLPAQGPGPGDREVREIFATSRRVTQLALAKGTECEMALKSPDGKEKCRDFAKFVDEELTRWQKRCQEIPVGGMAQAGIAVGELKAMRRDSRLIKQLVEKVKGSGL